MTAAGTPKFARRPRSCSATSQRGPVRVADAKKLLTDAGISVSTIQRAKQELRIRSVRERDEQGKTIGWTWRLPADDKREADGEEAR
jgi:hypothetical protein